MTVRGRLVGSFAAILLGPLVTVAVQLINVPIMLTFWGPRLYGEWLMISAIPTYLLLTDMGFGNVAGTDMTMRLNAGDVQGATETLHSTAALVLVTSVVIAVVVGVACLTLPISHILHLTALTSSEARRTLLLLCLNCLVLLQWSVLTAGYRSSGRYARGMFSVNIIRIVEAASFLIVLSTRARPPHLAAMMLAISVAGTCWLLWDLHRIAPDLRLGVSCGSRARIRELARPAFAFMAFPAGSALTTQGMTLTVGFILGPIAVAVFNPMRTLARTAFQLTDAVKNSIWPELSTAYGKGDMGLARRLHRTACQVSLLLAIVSLSGLAIAGPALFQFWTHGRVSFDRAAFYLLLLAVLANSAWNASSSVALSANKHERLSLLYLGCTSLSIPISVVLLHPLGLTGAPVAMLLADLVMSAYVVQLSNRLLSDDWLTFSRALLDPAILRSMARRLKPASR